MACRNCYKYPFCEKTNGADEEHFTTGIKDVNCEKSKLMMLEEIEYRKELRKQVKEMLED